MNALVIFMKAPRSGAVKTRMIPWLSPEEAADLYCALIQDTAAIASQVAGATTIPIASGEQALTRWDARDLLTRGGIMIMQFDCTRSAGITEVLKIAGMCAAQNVNLALHHDPQVHGHVMAALPNGEILETFPSAARDPIWAELFSVRPEIVNSQMELLDRPRWGLELNEDTLEKRGVRG